MVWMHVWNKVVNCASISKCPSQGARQEHNETPLLCHSLEDHRQQVCVYTRGQILTHLFSPAALLKDFIHTHVSPWCVKINSPFPDEWSKDNYSGSDQCWIATYTVLFPWAQHEGHTEQGRVTYFKHELSKRHRIAFCCSLLWRTHFRS